MKIITVTLSPAIDIHCATDSFNTERENFATITSRDAGGKGINISRALLACGTKSTAVVAIGEENGEGFLSALCADGIDCEAIWTSGSIRENITVHPVGAKETRLSFSGFSGDSTVVDGIESCVNGLAAEGDIVAIAGSIPKGIDIERVKAFVMALKVKGVRVVIDSRSFSPADITECAPFLIKPNEEEIVSYTNFEISSDDDAAKAAKFIFEKGVANVMISLGARGAVLACDEGIFIAKPPKTDAISTVGAGDSAIAGFLAAYCDGKKICDCLKNAVAYGSAACLTEGTKPPRKDDIERFLRNIDASKL